MKPTETMIVTATDWQDTANRLLGYAKEAGSPAVPDDNERPIGADCFNEDHLESIVGTFLSEADLFLLEVSQLVDYDQHSFERSAAMLSATMIVADHLLLTSEEDSEAIITQETTAAIELELKQLCATMVSSTLASDPTESRTRATEISAELTGLETAAGSECVALAVSEAVAYSPTVLDDGLRALLSGTAATRYKELRIALTGFKNVLKRSATTILEWFNDRVLRLLPTTAQTHLVESVQRILNDVNDGSGKLVGRTLGLALGRQQTEQTWSIVEADHPELAKALQQVTSVTGVHRDRIAWVARTRETLDRYGVRVVAAIAKDLHPLALVTYFATVAAFFLFVAYQLWDGLATIRTLAPRYS